MLRICANDRCARYLASVCPLSGQGVPAILPRCARYCEGVCPRWCFGEWFWSVPAKCARYQKVIKSVKQSVETVAGTLSRALSRALSTSTCDGPARGTCAMQPPLHSSRGGPGGLGGPRRLQQAWRFSGAPRRHQAGVGTPKRCRRSPKRPQAAAGGSRRLCPNPCDALNAYTRKCTRADYNLWQSAHDPPSLASPGKVLFMPSV